MVIAIEYRVKNREDRGIEQERRREYRNSSSRRMSRSSGEYGLEEKNKNN